MKTYSLQELNEFIRRVVALNFSESVWVTAEIGQIKSSRGHFYLDLLQKEGDEVVAQMSGVIWAMEYRRIQRILGANTEGVLADGMEIKLKGRLDFHERYGLKIIVEEIDATFTIGKLELERRKVITELQRKGLIGKNAGLNLPSVIQRIAVISSETAAGLQDFLNHIKFNESAYCFDVQLFQSAMQGSLVEKTMLAQLASIKAIHHQFDCVVIIRGGGARLDLTAFDNAAVGEAVAKFPLPVLTGIGHDVDQTVLDLVAHLALKTPTAVADFILTHNLKFESSLLEMGNYLNLYVQKRLDTEGGLLLRWADLLKYKTQFALKQENQTLDNWEKEMPKRVHQILKYENNQIGNLLKIIELMQIESILKRGFSISRVNGKVVTDADSVPKNAELTTQLSSGILKSKIIE